MYLEVFDQPADPAWLLFRARMQAGLTQSEVAHRAGLPRQTVSAYERRTRQPSMQILSTVLAGCGMRLRLEMVPEPGLEDEPTRQLLELAPHRRLVEAQQDAVLRLAELQSGATLLLVGGKAAARMHGAVIDVPRLEILVSSKRTPEEIALMHQAAGDAVVLDVEVPDHFDGMLERSASVELYDDGTLSVDIAGPGDCASSWYPRDLDHLALQRARRLNGR